MIHAFGCSFTRYFWPTWADLINQIEPCTNYGTAGLGNRAIYTRVFNALITGKIKQGDRVIVQWTGHTRYDRWQKPGQWARWGNVWNHEAAARSKGNGPPFDLNFLEHIWSDQDALIMSLTLAISLHELLTARGIEWQSMWMSDWRQFRLETGTHQVDTGQHVAILQDHWLELYSEQTIELSMLQWVKQQRSQQPALLWQMTPNRPKAEDLHPEPREHAQWLQRLQPLLKWSDDQWQQMSYLADTTQQELLQSNQANDLHPNCRDREPANPKDFYPGWPLYRKDHIDYRWDKEPI